MTECVSAHKHDLPLLQVDVVARAVCAVDFFMKCSSLRRRSTRATYANGQYGDTQTPHSQSCIGSPRLLRHGGALWQRVVLLQCGKIRNASAILLLFTEEIAIFVFNTVKHGSVFD